MVKVLIHWIKTTYSSECYTQHMKKPMAFESLQHAEAYAEGMRSAFESDCTSDDTHVVIVEDCSKAGLKMETFEIEKSTMVGDWQS